MNPTMKAHQAELFSELPTPFPGCRLDCHLQKEEDPTRRRRSRRSKRIWNFKLSTLPHKTSCFLRILILRISGKIGII
jgi:hypothetical protein